MILLVVGLAESATQESVEGLKVGWGAAELVKPRVADGVHRDLNQLHEGEALQADLPVLEGPSSPRGSISIAKTASGPAREPAEGVTSFPDGTRYGRLRREAATGRAER